MLKHRLAGALMAFLLSGCAMPALDSPQPAGVKLVTTPTANVSFYGVHIVNRDGFTYVEGRFSQSKPYGGGGPFLGYVEIGVTAPDGTIHKYVVEPITISRSGRIEHGLGYQNVGRSARFEVRLDRAPPQGSEVNVTYRS